jgi:putative heme-binding domain-containing protein
MATRVRNSADEWKSVVNDMVARGAQGSQEDLDNVVLYLSTNFGPGNATTTSAPAVSTAPSAPAQAASAIALSSSEIDKAKSVIQTNSCMTCHRVGNEGGYLAPSLNGIGTRRKPEEIRAAIVRPQPTLQPENREVRLITRDGKTVIGKILNQDGYSVQLVDASGQLATYSKAGLREFTIVDKNPMPSFENKITGQDLDSLVHYLSSLTEPGK